MKTTMEYTVGNTAFQIVNTGKRIKVIDVKKEKKKKKVVRRLCVSILSVCASVWCCFTIVNLQNTQTILDRKVYSLQAEIENLEHENTVLAKEYESETIDYAKVFKMAKALGMKFPTSDQIYRYTVQKSTAVRLNNSVIK